MVHENVFFLNTFVRVMGSQKAPAGKVMPRTGAEARRAGRAPAYSLVAALGLVVVCSLACARLLATHAPRLGTLLALPGDAGEDRVYGQIEGMNQKLRAENERLHKLLQRDENADIHVETRLQREDVRKSARLRQEMQREERLRAELDTVLGKAGQGRAADVVASGEAAESRRVREQSQVQSLLDAAKAQADEKLGLGDDSDVQRAFAADVDTALGPRESAMAEDGSERPGGAEGKRARLSARERRRLRRHERREYNDEMRESEVELRHGHPHRSRRALRRALADHEEEEKLRGFVGEAVYKKPRAWRLLRSTIKDDIADKVQAERVEDNMRAVVQLHRDVESAEHQYRDSKQIAAQGGPKTGRLAFMLNVPTRDGGFKAEKVITHKMEGELNKQERAWERADALEAAKAAAARELHLAEEGTHQPPPSSKLHIVGGTPMPKVHFIPKHPFGMLPSNKAPQQQLAATSAPATTIQREDEEGHPLPSPAALMGSDRGGASAAPPARGSSGGAYGREAEGYKAVAFPRPCEDCSRAYAPGHHCLACPQQPEVAAAAPREEEEIGNMHQMLNKLKVYHAPSTALNGQDLAIKSKWRGVKAVNKSRRYHGPAKDLPKEPREVSDDIVERLLKLAHSGALTAPEDVEKVEHPISAALSSHERDNQRVDKQEATYLIHKPAKASRHHETLKGPEGGAFPASRIVADMETPQMRSKILAKVESQALAREEARQAHKRTAEQAREAHTLQVAHEARQDAARVVQAEEQTAARESMEKQEEEQRMAKQRAAAARAQRRKQMREAEEARKRAMAPKGVWGLIAAPIHALFGDSEVQKASPYLPA